jgi:carboxypeptidase T
MRRRILSIACGISLFFASAAFAAPKSLVRVGGLSPAQISHLATEGYDIPKTGHGFAELVLEGPQIEAFAKKGHSIKVLVRDLDEYVKKVKQTQTKNSAYYTYATMIKKLNEWVEKYPDICRLESIGKSCEDRDIWALKISDNPGKNEPEPAALLMGAQHARAWPTTEGPKATAKKLLEEYNGDPEITRLVNEREIWIVPMVNPDGVTYSMEKSRMWRKNRRNNGGTYGVDLNRNYGYQWGNVGASNSGSSDTYHGTGPFSEPESCAMRDFVIREKFQASISYHTYSELILYPFGYGYNIPNPDQKIFVKMAGEMAKFNGYDPKNSAELYPAMGDSDDYFYGERKILCFTFELCSTFIPNASQIPTFNQLNVPAAIYLIDKAGTYGIVNPDGREEIVNNLSLDSSLRAITDIVELFGSEGNVAMRNEALKQLEKISLRTAGIVVEEIKSGNAEALDKVKAVPQASLAMSFIRNRVLFEDAHRSSQYRQDLIEKLKN